MAKIPFQLPGGRGTLTGPDATTLEGESRRQRARETPKQNGWWLSSLPDRGGFSNITLDAARAYVSYANPIQNSVVARYVRARVIALDAGGTLKVCVYRQQDNSNDFRIVPGTEATFPTDATGIQTIQLDRDVYLPSNERLFIGYLSSTALAEYTGLYMGPTNSSVIGNPYLSSQTVLPSPFVIQRYSTGLPVLSRDGGIPQIVYLSEDCRKVM